MAHTYKNVNFRSDTYYSNTYMMSHYPKYWYFLTIGSRGRGKTYSGKNYIIKWFLEQLDNGASHESMRKFMWWRLTDGAAEKVIENNGQTFFERSLLDKYKLVVRVVNTDIFFAKRDSVVIDSDGEPQLDYYHVGKVGSIQSYYKNKGNQYTDYDIIIMDELVRAESEKRTFNIPRAFINSIENVCRTRTGIRVMIYANAIGEMQEVKELFGFMPFPGKFGIYKLYHKRAIIEYLDDSKAWKEVQSKTMAGVLQSSSEFTNVHNNAMQEREDFFIERKSARPKKYFASIRIDKGRWLDIHILGNYYYVDTDNYTMKNASFTNCYAIHRELVTSKAKYSAEFTKMLKELWDVSKFRFSSPITYQWFTESLKNYNIF